MEVRVMTLTINGDMSKKEANLYVQQLKEKNPDKYFKTVDITVDGESLEKKIVRLNTRPGEKNHRLPSRYC